MDILNKPQDTSITNTAEALFNNAVEVANKGLMSNAMEKAREALIYAKYYGDYVMVYIHSFLAMANYENGKYKTAEIHCWHALKALNSKHSRYYADKEYFEALYEQIVAAKKEKEEEDLKIAC